MSVAGDRRVAAARAAVGEQLGERWKADDPRGYAAWREGRLVPARITQLLDMAGLEGPEVDVACGVVEPRVDEWEAGQVYPSWPEAVLLARLVQMHTVEVFAYDPPMLTGPTFVCPPPRGYDPWAAPADQRLSFAPAAIDVAVSRLW